MKNNHAAKEPGATTEELIVLLEEMLIKQGMEGFGCRKIIWASAVHTTYPGSSNHDGHPVAVNAG